MTETAPPPAQPIPRFRLRGAILIAVAILLLLGGLLVLGYSRPTSGQAYGAGARWTIAALLLGGWGCGSWGVYRLVVGSGVGRLAWLLKTVAGVAIAVGLLIAGLGGFVVREALKNEHRGGSSHGGWSHLDWFDD